jgi:hypothetical protein
MAQSDGPQNKGMKQTKPAQAMELRSLSLCSADWAGLTGNGDGPCRGE